MAKGCTVRLNDQYVLDVFGFAASSNDSEMHIDGVLEGDQVIRDGLDR